MADTECEDLEAWIRRGLDGLETFWEPELGLYLDHDLGSGRPLRALTVAGFAPLIAGHLDRERLESLLYTLDSPAFAGDPELRWSLPPSTSPKDPGFHLRSYWLLWWSLERAGETERSDRVRRASLTQLTDGGFGEYFEPMSGCPLGSMDQSWSAAVALDWIAGEEPVKTRAAA